MTIHLKHSDRPHSSISPRQSRPMDFGYGRIEPLPEDRDVSRSTLWIALVLLIIAVALIAWIAFGGVS